MLVFKNGLTFLAKNGMVFIDDTTATDAATFYAATSISGIVWKNIPRTW
jgi:hypothetical protein